MDFSLSDRALLHTLGSDKEPPWIEADVPVAQLEHQLAAVLMSVPDQLAFDLDDLDLVVVEPRHHIGRPMLGKQGQSLGLVKRLVVVVAPMRWHLWGSSQLDLPIRNDKLHLWTNGPGDHNFPTRNELDDDVASAATRR